MVDILYFENFIYFYVFELFENKCVTWREWSIKH